MKAITIAAVAIAVSAGSLVVAGGLKASLDARTDAFVKAVVDQSFGAVARLPAATSELQAALHPRRADRLAIHPDARPARSITVEQRIGTANSILVRVSKTELAQR